jgi:hypothetical protein
MNPFRKLVIGLSVLTAVCAAYAAGAASKKNATLIPAGELKWEDYAPGSPLKIVQLWGDRTKGEYAMLLKLPAGFEVPLHTHSADYQGITLQGVWVHPVEGDAASESKELPPMSYVDQPGKQVHRDTCKGTTDCVLFIRQAKKGDFIPAASAAKKTN